VPSSWGQPIIRSVMTTDLAPASATNASTSSATRMSSRMSVCSFENQRRRSVASASSAGVMPTVSLVAVVRAVERDRCDRPAAKSFLGPFAQSFAGTLDHCRHPGCGRAVCAPVIFSHRIFSQPAAYSWASRPAASWAATDA
jgi:hypothetical protein